MNNKELKKDIKVILKKQLQEYEKSFNDITSDERKNLRKWVALRYSVYDNPYLFYAESGCLMDYINADRIHNDMMIFPDDYK